MSLTKQDVIEIIREQDREFQIDFKKFLESFDEYKMGQDKAKDKILSEYQEVKLKLGDIEKASNDVNEWFRNINWSKKVLIGIVGFVGSLVAILYGVIQIIKSFHLHF